MKSFSAAFTLTLLFSLVNGLVTPIRDAAKVRDLENVFETRDINELLDTRATVPTFTFSGFPSSAVCAGVTYSATDIQQAASKAGQLSNAGQTVGTNKYPHQFFNRNNEIPNFEAQCTTTFLEFPILASKAVYTGGSPLTDRVVVNVAAGSTAGNVVITFCGVMTHTGAAKKNGFVSCTWK
ncbi:Ribonuclease/ribotoxin [Hypoxylon trugodes]|uniref:Ribonuclease/ribotoxin n=1 Tax=Hypoxylon trugodes TaxID=326681 RepID=UPI002190714F|nr:Ribonuclease/ribotoxin [Hypoxylon trugodes]KAI1383026.1 Ribonuclease/ribotoxin [Hypoxylon trugodes]